ncbi:MAG TPA: hypothetical protein VN429_10840 [Methanospirillum sp.]|uniref:hypothetical protein n=1 Tax=Methanospirillum sp. TaxID=45200 RepID=UPI002C6FAA64|nr:hypothetical protein [Methanospirillum sp.]HWQ64902.1 hypothetical protein [Methanospirillum sp.]
MTSPIFDTLNLLVQPDQVFEIRVIGEDFMASGYFTDHVRAEKAICDLDVYRKTQGIYITLNEINLALLSRRENRMKTPLTKRDATTADTDIIRRRWLPIDIDPVRPSGVSSSEDEHQSAIARSIQIAGFLRELGWPDPVRGDSGNGAHLLYSIDLPNDIESRDLVKRCLTALHRIFSDEHVLVDIANFNAARIWKLYGTISRKGDHTKERPHRRSCLLEIPERNEIVSVDHLMVLASLSEEQPSLQNNPSSNRPRTFILEDWLNATGFSYASKPYNGGTLFVLDECPFSSDHKDGAYAIQFANGAVYAGCHHNSCGSGRQRWSELKEMVHEPQSGRTCLPGYRSDSGSSRKTERKSPGKAALKRQILNEARTAPVCAEAVSEASRILRTGDPVKFMLDTFSQDHVGDQIVAECMVMSLASRSVLNSKGLHVSVTGESGKGKSHAFGSMLKQVPAEFRLDGRMSDKALFYIEDIRPGSVIALDDTALSEQMSEILKGVTTSFQEPFRYHTVTKDRKGQECQIPQRCV